jgi:dienelactone hydrolase
MAFTDHRAALRQRVQECVGLVPLPERGPLDVRMSEPLDHPWCRIQGVSYQLWPGVRAGGLLYRPTAWREKPAPTVLCPHGHWSDGNADPKVQSRCLMLARLGYVVFSPDQNHYEDLNWGISHQTLGVWGNMRALDFLETLAEVDGGRLGVCGESGGGLQTQMLVALDPRVKAAAIVGMTCPFREILSPYGAHCGCNHFPGVMRFTDAPELSTLGLPTPILYLTMNDWTRNFERDDFPGIARLYATNGWPERVRCHYEPTEHTYDRSKREWTYAWMEQWLRGSSQPQPLREPETIPTLPPEQLRKLDPTSPGDGSFKGISEAFRQRWSYRAPVFHDRADWTAWRDRRLAILGGLLGEDAQLARDPMGVETLSTNLFGELVVERMLCPSEGGLCIPVACLRRPGSKRPLPVVLICSPGGQSQLLWETGAGSAQDLAQRGALVVLPDVRFTGGYAFDALAPDLGPNLLRHVPPPCCLPRSLAPPESPR